MDQTTTQNKHKIECSGVVFDLDGVITRTAKLHFRAWKETFDSFLVSREDQQRQFDYEEDYLSYVDGRPRYQGVKGFLDSRDITLPYGDPEDSPDRETICGIGNRKNAAFRQIVEEDGVAVYQTTIACIKELREHGIRLAVASSSKNCRYILETSGLVELFSAIVGGEVSKAIGLRGKPDPDIFVVAAERLGLKPSECAMVEDALSGVEAGRNGNFGLVLGVARNGDRTQLLAHGADIVVADMEEFDYSRLQQWFAEGIERDSWRLTYNGFEPESERLREALTTVGNGYFGTRGCLEWEKANDDIHYPGTYIAGLYNTLGTEVHGKTIYNSDFVNCPNWLQLRMRVDDGPWYRLLDLKIEEYRHTLEMKKGLLCRVFVVEDEAGRRTRIESERFVSMDNAHQAALSYTLTPLDYSGEITLCSGLDGTVINYGVARYRNLESRHLQPVIEGVKNDELYLHVKTNQSKVKIFVNARHELRQGDTIVDARINYDEEEGQVEQLFRFPVEEGKRYTLEKVITIHTSRDQDVEDPHAAADHSLGACGNYSSLREAHLAAWSGLWEEVDLRLVGDRFAQKVLRLHTFHLLVTASPHSVNIDWSVPARGLHGEAYRGHIFWDELFILPFYNLHFPEVARSLLLYRYRRLDVAREDARINGHAGAMFPWQSGEEGREESQELHYNPVSGEWDPDLSRRQRHVSLAITYNVWAYFYISGDLAFLEAYGMELMVEIARFWTSLCTHDPESGRYSISGVMGPDEFHEKYPEAGVEDGSLRDNAYTNVMVSWLLHKTAETWDHLVGGVKEKLAEKLDLREDEIREWEKIVTSLRVLINDRGIIEQFDGYFQLKELDWEYYKKKYGDIHRMDRILKAEGDSPDRYKVAKQADVLMLFYLLSPGQVVTILEKMGYEPGDPIEFMKKNYNHYIKRTSHGSTLSHVVHAPILRYMHAHYSVMWERFMGALKSDVHDAQGGTTPEGIHCGVMAGTLDIVYKGFAGLNIFRDHLYFDPDLPRHWEELEFRFTCQGLRFRVWIDHEEIAVSRLDEKSGEFAVHVSNKKEMLSAGKTVRLRYG